MLSISPTIYKFTESDPSLQLESHLSSDTPIAFTPDRGLSYPLCDMIAITGTTPYFIAAIKTEKHAKCFFFDALELQHSKSSFKTAKIQYFQSDGHPIHPLFSPCTKRAALTRSDKKPEFVFREDLEKIFQEGLLLEDDTNDPDNIIKAAKCFEKASRWGHQKSKFELAILLYYGYRIEKNIEKALELFKELADHHPEAMYYLGKCLLHGIGLPASESKAYECFVNSANKGYGPAFFRLIKFLPLEKTPPTLIEVKAKAYIKAEKINKGLALYSKAKYMTAKIKGEPHKARFFDLFKRQALKDLTSAIREGSDKASFMMGVCLIEGTLGVRDIKKGVDLLCNAAGKGNIKASMKIIDINNMTHPAVQ